jgi:hypothetical protein
VHRDSIDAQEIDRDDPTGPAQGAPTAQTSIA